MIPVLGHLSRTLDPVVHVPSCGSFMVVNPKLNASSVKSAVSVITVPHHMQGCHTAPCERFRPEWSTRVPPACCPGYGSMSGHHLALDSAQRGRCGCVDTASSMAGTGGLTSSRWRCPDNPNRCCWSTCDLCQRGDSRLYTSDGSKFT